MRPGSSGVAARLPNNPGSQKLTPPSSAKEEVGMQAQRTAPAAKAQRVWDLRLRGSLDPFACATLTPCSGLHPNFNAPIKLSVGRASCLTISALRPL